MKKELTVEEFEKRLAAVSTAEPDEWDMQMLAEIDAENDTSKGVSLKEVTARRECSGKVSVRMPRELHHSLIKSANENGVSLNQFIVYKLAK
jgi:predicted HicB family RNase H-like nuclease